MSQHTYSAALIGLGTIAQGYSNPGDLRPYTHAGGLEKSERFDLVAAADLFPTARENFTEKWGATFPQIELFEDMHAMIQKTVPDCVTVCVRGPYHQSVMREILPLSLKVIFLEKPPTTSLADQDELLALAQKSGTQIVVSYSRHWAPRVLQATKLLSEGIIGDVHSVVAYCGGEVLSFASHTTDLVCQLASAQSGGVYAPVAVAAQGFTPEETAQNKVPAAFADYEMEPHLSKLHIEYSNGVTGLQIGGKSDNEQFYADVFGTKGRAKIGIYYGTTFWNEQNEEMTLPDLDIPDTGPFAAAYDQIAAYLDGTGKLECAGENFVAVNEIGFGAIESIHQNGARIELPNVRRNRKIYANN